MKNYTYIMLMGFALCIAHFSNGMDHPPLKDIIIWDHIGAFKKFFESGTLDKNTVIKYEIGDYSILQAAAISNSSKIIHYLIEQKVDLEYKTRRSKTALGLAIYFLHTESASILIKAGAQFNVQYMLDALGKVDQNIIIPLVTQDKNAATILRTFQAIAKNASGQLTELDKVKKIRKLYNVCKATRSNLTTIEETFTQVNTKISIDTQDLLTAAQCNTPELVELTINYGANIKEAINKLSNPQMRQFIRTAFIKREAALNTIGKKYRLPLDILNIIRKICRNEPV